MITTYKLLEQYYNGKKIVWFVLRTRQPCTVSEIECYFFPENESTYFSIKPVSKHNIVYFLVCYSDGIVNLEYPWKYPRGYNVGIQLFIIL